MLSKEKFEESIMRLYPLSYNPETKIMDLGDNLTSTLDEYYEVYSTKGRNLKCIYNEHPSLFTVYKCKDCGTVIIERQDEDFCLADWRCPTCVKQNRFSFKYWTQEQIDQDENLQKMMEIYKQMGIQQKKDNERYKRTGLYNYQLFAWKKYFKKFSIGFEITKIAGIQAEINFGLPCNSGIGYTVKWHLKIPLSLTSLKYFFKNPKAYLVIWK